MKHLLLITGIVLTFTSCEKFEINYEDFHDNSGKIIECHNSEDWTEDKYENAFIGKWEYAIGWCGWTGLIEPDFDTQIIQFKRNGEFVIDTDGQTQTSTWSVKTVESPNGEEYYQLEVEDGISPISGGVYICDDVMTTYTIAFDGCDRVFKKK